MVIGCVFLCIVVIGGARKNDNTRSRQTTCRKNNHSNKIIDNIFICSGLLIPVINDRRFNKLFKI